MALTVREIESFKPKSALYRVADDDGLCIEIAPSGGKLWRYRYRYEGKGQMMALGKFPAVSLAHPSELPALLEKIFKSLNHGKHQDILEFLPPLIYLNIF